MTLCESAFDTGVVRINYAEGPPCGLPLVFLHGGSGRWQGYADVLLELAVRFHLYAPDLRGHGGSGRVPGAYGLHDYAGDVIGFLQRCVGRPAFLLGHSLGGHVALLAAARCPQWVRAVVVGDSPLSIGERSGNIRLDRARARNAAWRDLAGGRLSIPEIVQALRDAPTEVPGRNEPVTMREKHGEDSPVLTWVASNLYHTDPDVIGAVLDGTVSAGMEMKEVLPAIRCPVLLLQADPEVGGLMTDDEVAWGMTLLTQGQHARLAQTGHFVFHPDPARIVGLVVAFLESIGPEAAK